MLAWFMKTPLAIDLIKKWSYDYIKMDCEGGKCYGVLAVRLLDPLLEHACLFSHKVHRICFALALFHLLVGASLIGVKDTKDKRAAIQNGCVVLCYLLTFAAC
jgi:serine incorporator 1/3